MKYRILGQTGIRVSEAALGTMTLGEKLDSGEPTKSSRRIFELFAEAGGNFIDTANTYTGGASEQVLGKLLTGVREHFVLGSKYTNQTDPTDPNSAGSSRKSLARSLDASLRRLNTDYIDVYWVHLRDELTPIEEIMRALDDQIQAGKILSVAVSDWSAWQVAQANTFARSEGLTPFCAVQLRYNLLDRTAENDLLPMANAFGISSVAWGPLADGRLTGKYLKEYEPDGQSRLSNGGWFRFSREGNDEIVREVVRIAAEGGWAPAQVAIAWLRAQPNRVIPLLAGRTETQFESNLAALEIEMDHDQLLRLGEVSAAPIPFPHNVTREQSIMLGAHGQQLPKIDDARAVQVLDKALHRSATNPWADGVR